MILNKGITPSEGEVSVKSYLCTSFNSMMFGIKADGYLEITSKRLLFQASGTGVASNKSIIHSEVPISEIVGINVYKGKGINPLRILGGLIIAALIAGLTSTILASLLSSLNDSPGLFQFIAWALFVGVLYLAYSRLDSQDGKHNIGVKDMDQSLLELALVSVALGVLILLYNTSLHRYNQFGTGKFAPLLGLVLLIIELYRYSKRAAFSLFIHSRSSSNSIVRISGPSPLGVAKSAAAKALTAMPGKDSLLVLQELGAVILDIQNLGEYGVEKWKAPVTA